MNKRWSKFLPLCVLATLLLCGPGCVHEPATQEFWSGESPTSPAAQRPVTADQVTPENARAVYQALRAEVPSTQQSGN